MKDNSIDLLWKKAAKQRSWDKAPRSLRVMLKLAFTLGFAIATKSACRTVRDASPRPGGALLSLLTLHSEEADAAYEAANDESAAPSA